MDDLEFHRRLFELFQPLDEVVIETSFIEINFSDKAREECGLMSIETEQIQQRMRLITSSMKVKVFGAVDDFLKIREISQNSNFLIIDESMSISYFNGHTFINFELAADYFLITNLQSYFEFQKFLKIQENEIDDAFHFVDSYNKDFRKISFVSLTEKGRLTINYNLKAPIFDPSKDYRQGFRRFQSCFNEENKSLPKFLKSSTINLVSNFPNETRFQQFFESLNDIVDKARINFEVYLNNLSIDKIRKDYDEVKSKYFDSLSDILSKLSQKIIALPVGVAATLFAVEKIKGTDLFLIFLIGALVITSIFLSLLLRIHFRDLKYIKKIFHFDYTSLIENNFFTKYPEELHLFEEVKERVNDRIYFLKFIIESYFWIMNLANIIIVSFILSFLGVKFIPIVTISTLILIVLTLFRNYVLEVDGNE